MTHDHAAAIARARLALTGLAVGDSFGETLMGEPRLVARRIARRLPAMHRPWRWTDDTAMAAAVVEVLAARATIDADALAAAFVRRWQADPDRGYGLGATQLLARLAGGAAWRPAAAALFRGRGSYGNGAAMRAAPIGAYWAGDLARACADAARSALVTHAHPDGVAGAVAVAAAAALVATGVRGAALLQAVTAVTPPGVVATRLGQARGLPAATPARDVADALGSGLDVAAHDTVPFALWVAAHCADRYDDALWTVTSVDGDRDTLGAIVGGITGMAVGLDGIPLMWRVACEPLPT
ncbi:MAG: ADP-ribosylglycohydrolase family protein [Myxococcales bacterium]|nr:ADP-ribosylglycohydrolase family protein [Myxococcales bacterium]MBK7191001.1 ADP-ribosylglycohydrolase family protein [Myxococcales bacterium]MBP6848329.1 ADP-ribosylglycohydrolase family protein [Kofleriaceae bacterium]